MASYRALRQSNCRFAVDFQGLLKSALVAVAARPERIYGFDAGQVRERAAALFYRHKIFSSSAHVVDRNLDLAAAAGARCDGPPVFPLPPGSPEGDLPAGEFVLASPLAGWASKQWPLAHYRALAARLAGAELVMFDGTLWHENEMIEQGLLGKTGTRMGHINMSGADGSIEAFSKLDVARKIFVHINNSNPVLNAFSPERAEAEAAGWEIGEDGMEIAL